MKKIIVILLFLYGGNSFAQSLKDKFINKLREDLFSFSSSEKLKDSIALYTFAIQVNIKNSSNKTTIDVSCNDSIANIIFISKYKSFLKGVNYEPLIGKAKKATIVIPIAYIIANYKADDLSEKKIPIKGLSDNLYKMFNCSVKDKAKTDSYIYLKPMITIADKAIYH